MKPNQMRLYFELSSFSTILMRMWVQEYQFLPKLFKIELVDSLSGHVLRKSPRNRNRKITFLYSSCYKMFVLGISLVTYTFVWNGIYQEQIGSTATKIYCAYCLCFANLDSEAVGFERYIAFSLYSIQTRI